MHQAGEQSLCHPGITEYMCQFAEAQIGVNDDAGLLSELAEQMEQQRPARRAERQIAKFIKDEEVKA